MTGDGAPVRERLEPDRWPTSSRFLASAASSGFARSTARSCGRIGNSSADRARPQGRVVRGARRRPRRAGSRTGRGARTSGSPPMDRDGSGRRSADAGGLSPLRRSCRRCTLRPWSVWPPESAWSCGDGRARPTSARHRPGLPVRTCGIGARRSERRRLQRCHPTRDHGGVAIPTNRPEPRGCVTRGGLRRRRRPRRRVERPPRGRRQFVHHRCVSPLRHRRDRRAARAVGGRGGVPAGDGERQSESVRGSSSGRRCATSPVFSSPSATPIPLCSSTAAPMWLPMLRAGQPMSV